MTLVFVGAVDDLRVPALLDCGDRVSGRPFNLSVDQRSSFARARVAWLGCRNPPLALEILQTKLQEQIEEAGFKLQNEAFQPHITIARHCRNFTESSPIPSIDWHVRQFVLVHSEPTPGGPMYRVVKQWALAA